MIHVSRLLAGMSPATGETVSVLPYVMGGVALVLLVAAIVLSVVTKKKK